LAPILITLLVFIAGTSALAFYRRNKLPVELRFYPAFEFNLPLLGELSGIDKVLSVFLAAAIVFALGSAVFFSTVVRRTGSIVGVTLAHGLTNIALYLILPFYF